MASPPNPLVPLVKPGKGCCISDGVPLFWNLGYATENNRTVKIIIIANIVLDILNYQEVIQII